MSSLSFLGATGTVTGSKFLVEHRGLKLLVDCGLFQGLKELRQRNWSAPPFDPGELDLIVLTHAHLDHTGYVPVMVKRGYRGRVLASSATCALCGILWPDSGYLQEEDARWANKRGYSKHKPALPLYTELEARQALGSLRPIAFDRAVKIHDGIRIRFYPAGHILGASFVEVRLADNGAEKVLLFTGDMGRLDRPIIPDPTPMPPCDALVIESTYGDRDHTEEDPEQRLAEIIRETVARGGMLLIPAFAVGRTQMLLFMLREMQRDGRLPTDIPIHVDSPMAIHTIRVCMDHHEAHDMEMRAMVANGEDPLGLREVYLDSTVQESKAINDLKYPAIIISASGMATGGRILHHLTYRLPDHRNTVLFTGHQAAGTRGRALQEGARTVKIHGREVPVRARIETLHGLSAHADRGEMVEWIGAAKRPPERVFVVHGEPEASEAFASLVREKTGIEAMVPRYLEKVEL
jgi:metallo-beta-lactamase family protein